MRYLLLLSRRIIFATLLCIVTLPCAEGETPYTPQAKEYLRKLDEPILLRGDYFKATMVAYHDFLKTMLASKAAMANIYARNGYKGCFRRRPRVVYQAFEDQEFRYQHRAIRVSLYGGYRSDFKGRYADSLWRRSCLSNRQKDFLDQKQDADEVARAGEGGSCQSTTSLYPAPEAVCNS